MSETFKVAKNWIKLIKKKHKLQSINQFCSTTKLIVLPNHKF